MTRQIGTLVIGAAAAVLLLASAGVSEAKGKKDMGPPISMPFCGHYQGQVCATKGGQRFTYHNGCFAVKDGAKVVSDKACGGGGKKKKK